MTHNCISKIGFKCIPGLDFVEFHKIPYSHQNTMWRESERDGEGGEKNGREWKTLGNNLAAFCNAINNDLI